jgi:uncharacterized protein YcbX
MAARVAVVQAGEAFRNFLLVLYDVPAKVLPHLMPNFGRHHRAGKASVYLDRNQVFSVEVWERKFQEAAATLQSNAGLSYFRS